MAPLIRHTHCSARPSEQLAIVLIRWILRKLISSDLSMIRFLIIFISCFWLFSCSPLLPATSIKHGEIHEYNYVYISQTETLTSSSGTSVNGQYYSTSKSVNPRDVISGILAKEGFILIPELKDEISSETLIVNYGQSGKRDTGFGSYALEVTIQFISSQTNSLIYSCTVEGRGSTEADDISEAITSCLQSVFANREGK